MHPKARDFPVMASSLLDREVLFANSEFGLDVRLTKATSKLGFIYPTLVQTKFIPLALAGKDVLARARTGSGKTAAYGLPDSPARITRPTTLGSARPNRPETR